MLLVTFYVKSYLVKVKPSSKWFSRDTLTPIRASILGEITLPRRTHTELYESFEILIQSNLEIGASFLE